MTAMNPIKYARRRRRGVGVVDVGIVRNGWGVILFLLLFFPTRTQASSVHEDPSRSLCEAQGYVVHGNETVKRAKKRVEESD